MIVRRYLTALFLVRSAGTLLALTAILQLLDLLDQASTIVSRRGVGAIGHYVMLRFPSLLAGAMPLAVLAGALLCCMRLSSGSEMTALRATGSSLGRIVGLLLPACALLAVLQLLLQALVAPISERALSRWWQNRIEQPASDLPPATGADAIWLRYGSEIVSVGRVSANGRGLDRVMIVHRSASGDLSDRIDAATARFADGRWTLRDVSVMRPDGTAAQTVAERAWSDGPRPDNMVDVARPVASETPWRLLRIPRGRWASAHGPLAAWTALDGLAIAMLDPVLMLLLAAPLLLSPPRADGSGLRILRVIGLGLGYLGLSGLLAAMGDSGALPPILATLAPTALFGAFALAGVLQADAG